MNEKRSPKAWVGTAARILRDDLAWAGVLAYDELHHRPAFLRPPPFQDGRDWASIQVPEPHPRQAPQPPPGHALHAPLSLAPPVCDGDLLHILKWLDVRVPRAWKMSRPLTPLRRAVDAAARSNPIHPVRAMLASVPWDGVERVGRESSASARSSFSASASRVRGLRRLDDVQLAKGSAVGAVPQRTADLVGHDDPIVEAMMQLNERELHLRQLNDGLGTPSWLHNVFQAESRPLGRGGGGPDHVRIAGRRWLISAVARVMDPGCPIDRSLAIVGPMGCGKTAGLRALGWPWVAHFGDADLRAAAFGREGSLMGAWIVETEIGQSTHYGRPGADLRRQVDRCRIDNRMRDVPRQSVFCGTATHRDRSLPFTDDRFWWCYVGQVDLDWMAKNRAQLWAEALVLYQQGEPWWQPCAEHEDCRAHPDLAAACADERFRATAAAPTEAPRGPEP